MAKLVTSLHNPLVKRARKLRARRGRDAEGAFLIEGIAPVWQALDHGADVEVLIVAPELLRSDGALRRIEKAESEGTPITQLGAEAFQSLAERDNPSGLAAIARPPSARLRDLTVEEDSIFVALEEVGNPGNLGTIVRTADAGGAAAVVTTGASTEPWHPAAIKASMGAVFARPVVHVDSTPELLSWAADVGIALITTSAHAPVSFWEAHYPAPALLLFGSEAHGLSPEVLRAGDVAVSIPMGGSGTSLNLAVAVGIVLFEVRRRA